MTSSLLTGVFIVVFLILPAAWVLWIGSMRALDRANGADWGSKWVNRLDGFNRIFCRRYHRLRADCLPLPETGPALLVSNHISGLDPMLLLASSRRPVRFIMDRSQYERFGFQWLFRSIGCIPVNQAEHPERAARAALRALQAGEVVGIFPHGHIHLESQSDHSLKHGVARLAHWAKVPVYAVHVDCVRGRGQVMKAVFLRDRARVSGGILVPCHTLPTQECLTRVAAIIDPAAIESIEGESSPA